MKNCLKDNIYSASVKKLATRDGFGEELLELGKQNTRIVVLSADLTESTRVSAFKESFPERFFDAGVAEQNMAGIGAGLALSGKIPFITSFGVFSPGRNWDQIRVSICYSNANVKIVGSHSGFSNGPDGATHQALEDIALARVLPKMTVVCPADYQQTKQVTRAVANHKGPVYLRFARNKTPVLFDEKCKFELGKAQVVKEGKDLTIISTGTILYQVLLAAKKLEENYKISVEIINIHTIKPLDEKAVVKSAKKTKKILTVEEHQIAGGLGGTIAESLGSKNVAKVVRLGAKDTFGESGQPDQLLEKYGLSANHIEIAAKELFHS